MVSLAKLVNWWTWDVINLRLDFWVYTLDKGEGAGLYKSGYEGSVCGDAMH